MARSSIIKITTSWTPCHSALADLFGVLSPNIAITSSARMNFTGAVPFDERSLESFAKAQKYVSDFEVKLGAAGETHKFETRIASVDADDAPAQVEELPE